MVINKSSKEAPESRNYVKDKHQDYVLPLIEILVQIWYTFSKLKFTNLPSIY